MFTLSSKSLVSNLRDLASSLSGKTVAAKLVVPDELKWWYYQEFGTTGSYEIHPTDGKSALLLPESDRYPGLGELLLPFVGPPHSALHPPIKARHFVLRVIPDIQHYAASALAQSLVASQFDVDSARDTLVHDVMPKAIELIANSMDQMLGPSREGGKLQGTPPREEYEANVQIVIAE